MQAPRLFTDTFKLIYLQNMSRVGLTAYSLALPIMAGSHIRSYYDWAISTSIKLSHMLTDTMLEKGVYTRAPHIPIPGKADFVQRKQFLTGWFGKRRTLESMEITNIFTSLLTCVFGKVLLTGFSQVAQSKKVREYMYRGVQIASKHIEVLSSVLREDDLAILQTWDAEVTNSTTAPFSDKLMMFHTHSLTMTGIANYGAASAQSMRHDLPAHYARLTAEVATYGEDGIKMMIDQGWLEQPPLAPDRDALALGKQ